MIPSWNISFQIVRALTIVGLSQAQPDEMRPDAYRSRRPLLSHADRPAYGWDSMTDTERHIAGLVAQGLSNRQVASRIFLSTHTVAFHLRHVFWKLGVSSRVQLARMAAERAAQSNDDRALSLR